jgi:heat shock protein HslJ
MKFYTLLAVVLAALALVTLAAGCSSSLAPAVSPGEPASQEPASLDGTAWTLVRLQGKDLIPETEATLTLKGDQIGGKASCNQYFGKATIREDSISIGQVGNTEMWCTTPEGVMDQETAYLESLGSAARYSVENDALTLYDADGQALLVFGPGTD